MKEEDHTPRPEKNCLSGDVLGAVAVAAAETGSTVGGGAVGNVNIRAQGAGSSSGFCIPGASIPRCQAVPRFLPLVQHPSGSKLRVI